AVTFTNKAAREMRDRVSALLEDVPLDSAPNLSTFHSLCVRMLRRDGDPLARLRPGFTRRFSIYGAADQLVIAKAAYRTLGPEARGLQQAAQLRHDRQVSGHQPQPIRIDAPADGTARQHLRRGRRRPVDLQLARRGHQEYPGFRARLSQSQDHPVGAELPLD